MGQGNCSYRPGLLTPAGSQWMLHDAGEPPAASIHHGERPKEKDLSQSHTERVQPGLTISRLSLSLVLQRRMIRRRAWWRRHGKQKEHSDSRDNLGHAGYCRCISPTPQASWACWAPTKKRPKGAPRPWGTANLVDSQTAARLRPSNSNALPLPRPAACRRADRHDLQRLGRFKARCVVGIHALRASQA